ncbi:hypothetical protein HNQ01_002172 [Leptothrix sp. C29]|uniref:Uncharacterized protein n=1 Tax=Sphaerotilus uruguayifluvii TaxID=2735897 RepID=A0ABX2G2Z7_9BURK|nr:hypothetical protein [Leptothrix sp. C29]
MDDLSAITLVSATIFVFLLWRWSRASRRVRE